MTRVLKSWFFGGGPVTAGDRGRRGEQMADTTLEGGIAEVSRPTIANPHTPKQILPIPGDWLKPEVELVFPCPVAVLLVL
jgi:hypothetical protein